MAVLSPYHWAEYLAIRMTAAALGALPFALSLRWGRGLGALAYAGLGSLRRRAEDNVRIAYGENFQARESRSLLRGVFQTIGLHAAELSQMVRRGRTGFSVENGEILRIAHGQGRGVILVSAHLGCFAKLALVPGLLGIPASVIMKKQSNWRLQEWVIGVMKRKFGIDVLLKKQAGDQVGDELRRGRIVGFFADQRPRGGGIAARFFGREVEVPRGPAVCAKRFGSPVVVITLQSSANGTHVARCDGPLSPEGSLEDVSGRWMGVLESRIREHPDQWMWMHRRWRDSASALRQAPDLPRA